MRWVTNKLDNHITSSLFSSHRILTRLTTKPRTETTSSLSCFTSGGSTSLSTACNEGDEYKEGGK